MSSSESGLLALIEGLNWTRRLSGILYWDILEYWHVKEYSLVQHTVAKVFIEGEFSLI